MFKRFKGKLSKRTIDRSFRENDFVLVEDLEDPKLSGCNIVTRDVINGELSFWVEHPIEMVTDWLNIEYCASDYLTFGNSQRMKKNPLAMSLDEYVEFKLKMDNDDA